MIVAASKADSSRNFIAKHLLTSAGPGATFGRGSALIRHRYRLHTDIFLTIFGRTDLKIGSSRAKNCEELDFEVRLSVDPSKLDQKEGKRCSRPKKIAPINFLGRKLNRWELSEMRFGKVSLRLEPCLRANGRRDVEANPPCP